MTPFSGLVLPLTAISTSKGTICPRARSFGASDVTASRSLGIKVGPYATASVRGSANLPVPGQASEAGGCLS